MLENENTIVLNCSFPTVLTRNMPEIPVLEYEALVALSLAILHTSQMMQ